MLGGNNDFGKLGLGNREDYFTPKIIESVRNIKFLKISAGENHSLALDVQGKLYSWGNNDYGQLGLGEIEDQIVPKAIDFRNKVLNIVTKYNHNIAIVQERGCPAYAWGDNSQRQLGLPDFQANVEKRSIPTKVAFPD